MLRKWLAERESELPLSTIGKLIRIAEEDKQVVSLGPGEPDFDAPPEVVRAAQEMLGKGETHYAPPQGRKELREAIVRKLKKENRIDAHPDQILVTAGSTEAILLTLLASTDPGEGVLLPDPGFLSYRPTVEVLSGMPISYPLFSRDGFQVDTDRMAEAIVPEKTNVLILNTPSNPTGTVLSRRTLEEIADFATEYGLLVLVDEAYERLVYGKRHVSFGGLNGMAGRTVTLQSFSKTYAMPGFRVGYAVGPEQMIRAMTKLHIFTSISAPTIGQLAAAVALEKAGAHTRMMVKEYGRRRGFLYRKVRSWGWPCARPDGAFYLFPEIRKYKKDSLEFATFLLEKAKVAVVPGSEFGRRGEGFIRLSYATKMEQIKVAVERIERVM